MTELNPTPDTELKTAEAQDRVLYAFVRAAARLGATFGMPLKGFERFAHMATFHVLRTQGLELGAIAERLQVSRRKVDQLSRLLKENFFERHIEATSDAALGRRIEFMLWAEPLSTRRICQVVHTAPPEAVDAALSRLVEAGRIAEGDDGKWQTTTPSRRLVRDDWLARIDGLNHQLGAVLRAAHGRFFKRDSRAFARTVSLRVRRARVPELEALYRDVIWPALVALDADCQDADPADIEEMIVSLCWASAEPLSPTPDTKD